MFAQVLTPDPRAALAAAPTRQARWLLGAASVSATAWWWPTLPDLTAAAVAGVLCGAVAASPDLRAAGSAAWCTLAGAGVASLLGLVLPLGAAAGAGASLGLRALHPTPPRDAAFTALTSVALTLLIAPATATLAALTSTSASLGLLPADPSRAAWAATVLGACAPLSFAVWMPAWRHDHPPSPARASQRGLTGPYAERAAHASGLYDQCATLVPDVATRRGLHEVATWVHRLLHTRHQLDQELLRLAPGRRGFDLGAEPPSEPDSFTRERLRAARQHMQRVEEHRAVMAREARRAEALVDYALAFLEDARASLAIGHLRPGTDTPAQLGEVLRRLRSHAVEQEAAVRTQHELNPPIG